MIEIPFRDVFDPTKDHSVERGVQCDEEGCAEPAVLTPFYRLVAARRVFEVRFYCKEWHRRVIEHFKAATGETARAPEETTRR